MTESNAVMLPKDVRPSRYTLTLRPDLETFTFSGSVAIDIEVLRPTDSIVLNAAELAITSCRVESPAWEALPSGTALDEKAGDRGVHVRLGTPGRAREAGDRVHRRAERPAPGILPQPVHRRERRGAALGDDPVRGDRRPPRLPMLGRAVDEGFVPGDAHRPRGVGGRIEHDDRRGVGDGRRTEARAVRGDAGDVDLPARLHRGRHQVRGAEGRERHPRAGVGDGRQGEPGRVLPPRRRSSSCPSSTTTSACPTRCRSSTT